MWSILSDGYWSTPGACACICFCIGTTSCDLEEMCKGGRLATHRERATRGAARTVIWGTQDSFGDAEGFTMDYDTQSFAMLWDEPFEMWRVITACARTT
jgi:hypothetical protein